MRAVRILVAAGLMVAIAGCGGGSGSPAGPDGSWMESSGPEGFAELPGGANSSVRRSSAVGRASATSTRAVVFEGGVSEGGSAEGRGADDGGCSITGSTASGR